MDDFIVELQRIFESLDSMGAANLFGSLGFTAVLLFLGRWLVDRRRWGQFKASVHRWLDSLIEMQNKHPKHIRDQEWQAECERMLVDARFRPAEVVLLLDLSVTVAKAIAAKKIVM